MTRNGSHGIWGRRKCPSGEQVEPGWSYDTTVRRDIRGRQIILPEFFFRRCACRVVREGSIIGPLQILNLRMTMEGGNAQPFCDTKIHNSESLKKFISPCSTGELDAIFSYPYFCQIQREPHTLTRCFSLLAVAYETAPKPTAGCHHFWQG